MRPAQLATSTPSVCVVLIVPDQGKSFSTSIIVPTHIHTLTRHGSVAKEKRKKRVAIVANPQKFSLQFSGSKYLLAEILFTRVTMCIQVDHKKNKIRRCRVHLNKPFDSFFFFFPFTPFFNICFVKKTFEFSSLVGYRTTPTIPSTDIGRCYVITVGPSLLICYLAVCSACSRSRWSKVCWSNGRWRERDGGKERVRSERTPAPPSRGLATIRARA